MIYSVADDLIFFLGVIVVGVIDLYYIVFFSKFNKIRRMARTIERYLLVDTQGVRTRMTSAPLKETCINKDVN